MTQHNPHPRILTITGQRGSGRTTFAVMVCGEYFKHGFPCFHNGSAFIGWNIEEYTKSEYGLRQLADEVPSGSVILIEEADVCSATRQLDDPNREASITLALATLAEKGCFLILTTVQGNERLIAWQLVENSNEHVTPAMDAKIRFRPSLATTHRIGRYLVPACQIVHETEDIIDAMLVADSFKDMRGGHPEGRATTYTDDRFFEVQQTGIDNMKHPKHPEYPIFYRSRIVRRLRDGNTHRLFQNSILHFTWLESVNEHRNETIALELFERAMLQWGFDYQAIPTIQDTHFPDGQASVNGEVANLEVVSIQPRYPGGHSLHDLTGLTQPSWALRPEGSAVMRCQTCSTTEPIEMASLKEIPEHNQNHRWVIYAPGSLFTPDFPEDLTVTPELTITQEGFTLELENALAGKSQKIAEQGTGRQNWVLVAAQGFPIDPDWYGQLPIRWPQNIDGICVVATESYWGAYADWFPYNDFVVALIKCPADARTHNCYHPGFRFRVGSLDAGLQPLSEDKHNIEDVSTSMLNFPWAARPIKRSLTLRDEDGNEIASYWGASLTESQALEILTTSGYCWRELSPNEFELAPEGDHVQADCLARVSRERNEEWAAAVSVSDEQLLQEVFASAEEAQKWCEARVATALIHLEQ